DLLDGEACATQQVLDFKPEEIPQCKCVHQAFFPAVGIRHVIDQFVLADLLESVRSRALPAAYHSTTVGHGELGLGIQFLAERPIDQCLQHRIENIENQMTSASQMTSDAGQTGKLVISCQQLLERSERAGHEG